MHPVYVPYPTKLTPERVDRICEMAAEENFLEHIAAANGIGVRTLQTWRDTGRDALHKRDQGDELTEHERLCAAFYERFTAAEAELERRLLKVVLEEDRKYYAAITWFLERRWPKRYGRGQRLEVEHSGGVAGSSAVVVLPANGREAPPDEDDRHGAPVH